MTKKVGVGQAHSKIILIGEHAVVYGYPAISLPLLEVEVTCKVVPAESPWRLYEEDTLSHGSLCFSGVFEYQRSLHSL